MNSSLVLDKIIKQTASSIKTEVIRVLNTPLSSRAIRRVQKVYVEQSTSFLLDKILKANERLTAEHSIDQHIIRGLTEALKNEKKRRKRRIRLNLIEEKEEGPQFFSSSKMQATRNFQTSKKKKKLQKKQEITKKRTQIVINKVLKEKVKQKRFLAAAEKRRLKEKALRAKAVEKQAQNELNFAATRPRQLIVRLKLPRTGSIEGGMSKIRLSMLKKKKWRG